MFIAKIPSSTAAPLAVKGANHKPGLWNYVDLECCVATVCHQEWGAVSYSSLSITQVKIYSSSYLTRPTLEHRWTLGCLRSIYPDMINHFASQSQTCQLLLHFFNIEMKLWKVVQTQVQLMSSNIKYEVPILWFFQVQIITNIIY